MWGTRSYCKRDLNKPKNYTRQINGSPSLFVSSPVLEFKVGQSQHLDSRMILLSELEDT